MWASMGSRAGVMNLINEALKKQGYGEDFFSQSDQKALAEIHLEEYKLIPLNLGKIAQKLGVLHIDLQQVKGFPSCVKKYLLTLPGDKAGVVYDKFPSIISNLKTLTDQQINLDGLLPGTLEFLLTLPKNELDEIIKVPNIGQALYHADQYLLSLSTDERSQISPGYHANIIANLKRLNSHKIGLDGLLKPEIIGYLLTLPATDKKTDAIYSNLKKLLGKKDINLKTLPSQEVIALLQSKKFEKNYKQIIKNKKLEAASRGNHISKAALPMKAY